MKGNTDRMNIGIIGGGLSGVTLQKLLRFDAEILEKDEKIGGLCRTFSKDGFSYDIGGHILYSKDEKLMSFIKESLGSNINYCRRENKIFYKDRFVKYPFENGLGALDKTDIYDCLLGYLQNEHPKPTNFREWILYTFGSGIAEKYLIPYNEKIWKTPLTEMSLEWMERVPKPPLEDILKSAIGIETEGYVHQLFFNYPSKGGIEGLITALTKQNACITTGFAVNKIMKKKDGWEVSDGKRSKFYEKLIVTIPITEALNMMESVPAPVLEASRLLRHNSVRVVMIGIDNESLMDKSAIYVPSPDITPHRICYMGFFSKNNVPQGTSSIMAEVTVNERIALSKVSDAGLIEKVAEDLDKIGIIKKQEIIATDIHNSEYGYVVYDHAYKKSIAIVREYCNSIGITLHGRFAEFEYINMDEVIRRSIALGDRINAEKN
jgi:protoporphyrinogen oxidase